MYDDLEVTLTEFNSNLYSKNYNSFDEWFYLIKNKKDVYPYFKIPYASWFHDYLDNIDKRSIKEVKALLRCLLCPFTRNIDISRRNTIESIINNNKVFEDLNEEVRNDIKFRINNDESYNRVKENFHAWEGLTWVIALLPNHPYKSIEALQIYLKSEINILPDDRITGIEQCIEIILAKFIKFSIPINELLKLKSIEFEWLIEELYSSMGYETEWTKATRDGGKDIIAKINRYDGVEKVYVECKLYNTTKLDINSVKAFGYTISEDKINRGIIFCTGYVSEKLKNVDKRIKILTYNEIIFLLNAHLGSNWINNLGNIIERKRKEYNKTLS